MEAKKSQKADLESRKNLFLEVGLIFSLSLALLAFEWRSPVRNNVELTGLKSLVDEQDIIDITTHETPKPVNVPPTFTNFEMVDNTVLTEDFFPIDAETFPSEEIPVYIKEVSTVLPEEKSDENGEIFRVVEEQPEFPGGYAEMKKFLALNIKYPEVAKSTNISGKVYLMFVVEKDGSVSNINVARGIGGGCEEEAIRVLKMMPNWIPGKQRGKPVRVSFNIPIEFRLQ
jgi:protein TonB